MEQSRTTRTHLPGLAAREGYLSHTFDEEHGVRTSGLVAGRHLKTGHAHDRHATAYYGVAPSVFASLLVRWQRMRPAAQVQDTTFIDVGAGMGRAVLLASETPFRQVIGIELHPTLAHIARRNANLWRKAHREQAPIRIVCGDAVEFQFPSGPCVAFLFNPFGATVMRRWLSSLSRQFRDRPQQLDILYVNNEQEGLFEQRPGLVRIFLGKVRRSRTDFEMDRRILNNQPDGEYASHPYEDCSIWRWTGKRSPD